MKHPRTGETTHEFEVGDVVRNGGGSVDWTVHEATWSCVTLYSKATGQWRHFFTDSDQLHNRIDRLRRVDTNACGCPAETPVTQVSEHDVRCNGCGTVSA